MSRIRTRTKNISNSNEWKQIVTIDAIGKPSSKTQPIPLTGLMPVKILALDTATHCGYAISRELYGTWNLTPRRDESIGMRLIKFRSKLQEIIASEHINLVVFERPGGRFAGAIIVHSELQGQIKVVCEDMKVSYRGYSSKEIKLFATGKGGAKKAAMIQAAKDKLGYPGNDDNEADALWLLELAKNDYK